MKQRMPARDRLAVAAICLLLGFLVVVQARSQASGTGLEDSSAQDLTLLVANLTTRNDQLRSDVADLERQLAALQADQARGGTSVDQLQADLDRVRAWSGVAAVQGPGVHVLVHGPISGTGIADLLNELRNAGSEAIAVAGIRVVAGTAVSGPPGGVAVDGAPLDDPVEVEAIGSSAALVGSLMRPGGIVAQLAATYAGVTVDVTPVDLLTLPATARNLVPADGKPAL
jgi:uncharacterized protein YlxW (UPF0749 family)